MPTMFPSRRLVDPADLRVIAALEAVGAGRSTVQLPTMSASFRDDLRAQLVAVAPRLVTEGVRPGTETAPRAASARKTSKAEPAARSTGRARTRPMTVLVAGAAVVVLGLGGATWLARGALPGDALYGLKRTAEGVDVSLSGSNLDKGHALLVGAQTRVQEVDDLIQRPQSMALGTGTSAAGGLSDSTVKLVVSTLATADTDTQKGVSTIGDDAIARHATDGLTLVVGWAGGDDGKGGQIGRIQSLVDRIPSTAAHDSAQKSLTNIGLAYQRARDLLADVKAGTSCTRGRDAFGPQPCAATATKAPTAPGTSSPAPTSGTTSSNPGGGSSGTPNPVTSSTPPPAPATSADPSPTRSKPAGRTSSNPPAVAVDSCGVQVSIPVVDVSLGTCTPSR